MNKVLLIITALILFTSQQCFAAYCNVCCTDESATLFCTSTTQEDVCTGGCACCNLANGEVIYEVNDDTQGCCNGTPYKNGADTQDCCETGQGKTVVSVVGGTVNGLQACCTKIDKCLKYDSNCACTECKDGYKPEDGACKKEEDCLCYHGPNDLGCLVCENDEGYCNELKEEGYEPGDPWCPGTCVDGGLWCECEIEDCYLATANQDTKKCQCECKTEEECL